MGQEKLSLEGFGMEWGGGNLLFSHNESRKFLIHLNSISCQKLPKKASEIVQRIRGKEKQSKFVSRESL